MMAQPAPYKITPIFDQDSLPMAIRNEHRTKEGVWGLLRVLEGEVRLIFNDDPSPLHVTPTSPGVIPPARPHHVEVIGPMKMQVEFYHGHPLHG